MDSFIHEREDITKKLRYLTKEQMTLIDEIARNIKYIGYAESAKEFWVNEINMLNLVHFCNTGKFPD